MPARLLKLIVWSLAAAPWVGCHPEGTRPERDEVARGSSKAQPGVVQLSPDAQRRAGVVVEGASKSRQPAFLKATGWLVAKPGAEVTVKAPATGFVTLATVKADIGPGFVVERTGQPLGEIQVVLSPQEQANLVAAKEQADVLIRQSLTSLKLGEAQLERVRESKDAVAGTRILELQEKVEHARAAYEEARDRLPFLPKEPYANPLPVKPVPIEAPLAGRVVSVHVRPGQFVVQGDRLWTIADWSALWVRVPVFELDLPQVERHEPAELEVPGHPQAGPGMRLTANPVDAPQPTRFGQRTVDLYYEIPNRCDTLRVGQAVAVLLLTGQPVDRIVVPRAAVLWDGMGGTWVYVQVGSDAFRRQRVELGRVLEDRVEVTRGLDEGAKVVSVSAEVLYGEEFKGEIPVEDQD
jgi:cobalt-zinc-cadmium efflux system membrane fusion protein